jgi:PhnB protein
MDTSTLHPNLTVRDAAAAISFYTEAFAAELIDRITAGDTIVHSDLRVGDSTFTVAAEFAGSSQAPEPASPSSVSFTLNVEDVDASFTRAVAAGATPVAEPADWFEGFRQSELRDPFGHRWFLVAVADSVTVADIQRASDAWSAPTPA